MKTASIDINRKENRKGILSISHILFEVSNNVNTCIQQTIRFSEKMNFATKSFTPYAQTVNRYCMTLKGKKYDYCTAFFISLGSSKFEKNQKRN